MEAIKTKKSIKIISLILVIGTIVLSLAGCSAKLKGTYMSESGLGYAFAGDDQGTMIVMGIETPMVYSVEGDTLTINGVPYTYELDGNTLTLTDMAGGEIQYIKE